MSMTRVGGATGTTSVSMPSHQAGDLIVAFVFRDGSTTAPTVPSGWIEVATGAANTCWGGLYFKIANSSGETSGTWTSASRISVACYRPGGTRGLGIGAVATGGAASTTVSYPALTMAIGDGSSWVGGAAGHRSTNTSLEDAPPGMTNVAAASGVDGTAETALHDTDGPVSSWSNQNVSVGGTSSGWRSFTFEIVHRTVFNPRDKGPDAVLSSANTIIVSTGGAGNQYARGTVGRRAGDHVIRFTIGGNSYTFAGVATHDASLTSSPSNGGKIGYRTSTPDGGSPEGRFYTADGNYTGGLPLAQPGDVVDIYISRSLGRMWVVINGTPTTGNPSAKTGGYDITTSLASGETLFPIAGGDNDWGWGYGAAEVTIDAALTGVTLPSGWEPWDGIEAEGGDTYDESLSFGVGLDVGQAGAAVVDGAINLGAQAAMNKAAALNAAAAISLTAQVAVSGETTVAVGGELALGVAAAAAAVGGGAFDEAIELSAALDLSPVAQKEVVGAITLAAAVSQANVGALTAQEALELAVQAGFSPSGAIDAQAVASLAVAASLASAGATAARTFEEALAFGVVAQAIAASQLDAAGEIDLAVVAAAEARANAQQNVVLALAASLRQAVASALEISEALDLSVAVSAEASGGFVIEGAISLAAGMSAKVESLAALEAGLTFTAAFDAEAASVLTADEALALAVQTAVQVSTPAANVIVSAIELDGRMSRTVALSGLHSPTKALRGVMQIAVSLRGRLN